MFKKSGPFCFCTISKKIIEPRFHIDQKLNAKWRATLSGELKHQTVYQTVNIRDNLLGVETRDWLVADTEDNKILNSKQLGVGLNYAQNNWIIATEFFLKNVENIKHFWMNNGANSSWNRLS